MDSQTTIDLYYYKVLADSSDKWVEVSKQCETNAATDESSCAYGSSTGDIGGHANNILDYDSTHCAKRIIVSETSKQISKTTRQELAFYNTIYNLKQVHELPFLSFFPETTLALCQRGQDRYYSIENIKSGLTDIQLIDFKIGRRTAMYPDSSYLKDARMKLIDSKFSTSKQLGFRCEGFSGKYSVLGVERDRIVVVNKREGNRKFTVACNFDNCANTLKSSLGTISRAKSKKYDKYVIHPYLYFKLMFMDFKPGELEDVILQLANYSYYAQQNADVVERLFDNNNASDYGSFGVSMIGSSIILVTGKDRKNKAVAKMMPIDFAHAYFVTPKYIQSLPESEFAAWKKFHIKVSRYYAEGVANLLRHLVEFRNLYMWGVSSEGNAPAPIRVTPLTSDSKTKKK
jgi:hypothetical protein